MKAVEEKAQETAMHEVDKMLSSSLIQNMAKDIQELRESLNREAAPQVEQGAARDGDQSSTQGKERYFKSNHKKHNMIRNKQRTHELDQQHLSWHHIESHRGRGRGMPRGRGRSTDQHLIGHQRHHLQVQVIDPWQEHSWRKNKGRGWIYEPDLTAGRGRGRRDKNY